MELEATVALRYLDGKIRIKVGSTRCVGERLIGSDLYSKIILPAPCVHVLARSSHMCE